MFRTVSQRSPAFQSPRLTPQQEADLLARLDAGGGQATPGQLAATVGLSVPAVRPLLEQLSDRDLVRAVSARPRAVYERVRLEVNELLVRDAYRSLIREHLTGRRDLPGSIARVLRLPEDEVRATCKGHSGIRGDASSGLCWRKG